MNLPHFLLFPPTSHPCNVPSCFIVALSRCHTKSVIHKNLGLNTAATPTMGRGGGGETL